MSEEPIRAAHARFARALVALAREHGVGSLEVRFQRDASSLFRGQPDEWSAEAVTVRWKEGRHGAENRITLQAVADSAITEQAPPETCPVCLMALDAGDHAGCASMALDHMASLQP